MRLLLTNDDGIQSPGLAALATALSPLAEVYVVAPDRERSAISQAISLHRPLRARQTQERWFMVDGTPVDCVYLALAKLLPEPPDLVISGINLGANLGQDVFYSGTVGAAMEATIQGICGIALSLDVLTLPRREELPAALAAAASFARELVHKAAAAALPTGTTLNVNFPGAPAKGVAITRLGRRHYGKEVLERRDPRGKRYYWIGGARAAFADIEGSDCNALQRQEISISPLRLDLSAEALAPTLAAWSLTPPDDPR